MKKILITCLFVSLILMTTACRKTTTTQTTVENREPVTITYAAWNLGTADTPNINREMIRAFQERYPWITVDILERPKVPNPGDPTKEVDMNWDEFLRARAAIGQLPDVFMYAVVPNTITSEWAYDVTSLMSNDPEFLKIPEDIRNAAVYEGKYMAIPVKATYMGYFVNKTLFDRANLDYPTYGITFTDLMESASDVAVHQEGGNGIVGIEGVDRVFEWYPAQINENLGWYTFNGSKYNFTDPAFSTAVALQKQLYTEKSYVFEATTGAERTAYFGEGWPWGKGKHAIKWDQSGSVGWISRDANDPTKGIYNMEFDFIGTPVVEVTPTKSIQRIPVVLDYVVMGASTKHPEAAYLFAKWMGFGKEGYLKAIEISNTVQGINKLDFTPLQQDPELLNAFFNLYPNMTEFRKVAEHDAFILEGLKMVPGYEKSRYTGQYDAENTMGQMMDKVVNGTVNLADVASSLEATANREYTNSITEIRNALK